MFNMVKIDENGNLPRDEMIEFYHREFTATLETFGYPKTIPSMANLTKELAKYGQLNVLLGIAFAPFVFLDTEKMKMDDLFQDDSVNYKKSLYENPACTQFLQNAFKYWSEKGWLDDEEKNP
jgi:hypothetical protein